MSATDDMRAAVSILLDRVAPARDAAARLARLTALVWMVCLAVTLTVAAHTDGTPR